MLLEPATTLEVEGDAPIVLPDTAKLALGVEDGGACQVFQFQGLVILSPRPLVTYDALEGLRREMQAANVTTDELLAAQAQIREEIFHKKYGSLIAGPSIS